MKALKTRVENAQALLQELKSKSALAQGFKPFAKEGFFYAPISQKVGTKTPCEQSNANFEKRELNPIKLGAFDVVGSVAILENAEKTSPDDARKNAAEIMQSQNRVKTVAVKTGATGGAYRVRPLRVIAGKKSLLTIHKENGCLFKVDLSKVYFQPRLSFERNRVANAVKKKESVLVLFAGVGPFAIEIAKAQPSAKVVGVELNPDATKLFEENIVLNKARNVKAVRADAKKFLGENRKKWNRAIMPHPTAAFEFLPLALKACDENATVHFYCIVENEGGEKKAIERIKKICKENNHSCRMRLCRKALSYSPSKHQAVFDFKVRQLQRHAARMKK